jgi:glutamate carboxypeptidase
MTTQKIAELVAANEPRLLSRLRELVEIESPSEDKAAVDRANDLVAAWATDLGATVKRHRQKTHGDVLELRFGPPRSKRSRILLLGHLDTVWPLGTLAKMPWRKADGKIFGPGILDMKSGVVMALEALTALKQLAAEHPGLDRPVTLLLNSDEEIGSPISRPITEKLASQCSAVFVLEPAQGLAYKTARKGIGNYRLHVQGVASHSGVDFDRGHSAALEMSRLVQTVSAFTDLGKGLTVNVGTINGGTRSNVVAAECTAEVDVRIVRATDAARVDKLFRSLRTTDKACQLTITGGINRPPMERKPGTIALFKQSRKLAAQLGFTLDEASTGGGSDGNFTAALGVPTLDGMGSVGAGAHATHEHIDRTHLTERTTLLAAMLATVD